MNAPSISSALPERPTAWLTESTVAASAPLSLHTPGPIPPVDDDEDEEDDDRKGGGTGGGNIDPDDDEEVDDEDDDDDADKRWAGPAARRSPLGSRAIMV